MSPLRVPSELNAALLPRVALGPPRHCDVSIRLMRVELLHDFSRLSIAARRWISGSPSAHTSSSVAPDLFSMQGLENVGPRLKMWRKQWADRLACAPELDFDLPPGTMTSIGYVVARHSMVASGAVKTSQRWIERMPGVYRRSFDEPEVEDLDVHSDELCLGQLKDFRSLRPMAEEAKKPMFLLKPADGAIGGHQEAVRQAYKDFGQLAEVIAKAMGGLS